MRDVNSGSVVVPSGRRGPFYLNYEGCKHTIFLVIVAIAVGFI